MDFDFVGTPSRRHLSHDGRRGSASTSAALLDEHLRTMTARPGLKPSSACRPFLDRPENEDSGFRRRLRTPAIVQWILRSDSVQLHGIMRFLSSRLRSTPRSSRNPLDLQAAGEIFKPAKVHAPGATTSRLRSDCLTLCPKFRAFRPDRMYSAITVCSAPIHEMTSQE